MLFLTYHKVQKAGVPGGGEFYTVTEPQLAAHLGTLAARKIRVGGVDDLLVGAPKPGVCALTFDDGTADHFDVVLPALRESGVRAIFFPPTAKLDRPGYLTRPQIREIAAAGHTIGSHSHEHRRLDRMRDAEIREQLRTSIEILGELAGTPPRILAPPGGFLDERVKTIALDLGFRAIRTMRWGLNRDLDPCALECIPMSRFVTPARFVKMLDGGGLGWFKCLYLAKEILKLLVPMNLYARLRNSAIPNRSH